MLRIALLSICLVCACSITQGQRTVNKFIDKHLKNEKAIAMSLPGWLIRTGANIARNFSDEEDVKEYLKLAKYIKKVRFMVIEDDVDIEYDEMRSLLTNIRKDEFEDFVKVRDKRDHVHILMKESSGDLKNLVILVYEPENLVVVSLKLNLPMEEFEALDFSPVYEKT